MLNNKNTFTSETPDYDTRLGQEQHTWSISFCARPNRLCVRLTACIEAEDVEQNLVQGTSKNLTALYQ